MNQQTGLFQRFNLGGTPYDQMSKDAIDARRALMARLMARNTRPSTALEGIGAIGAALMARRSGNKLDEREGVLRQEYDAKWDQLLGGGFGGAPQASGPTPATFMPGGGDDMVQGGQGADMLASPAQTLRDEPRSGSFATTSPVQNMPMPQVEGPIDPSQVRQNMPMPTPQGAQDLAQGIIETARAIGADPLDLATAISYETAGTFDPTKRGPTTQWGQHRGLIQFGEPQARQHGVDWNDPIGSQLGPDGAIASYFRSSGFKPGMSGLDLYSTINAGAPGRYSASDANNGGAPGDVRDKWENQMADHRAKAAALLGGEYTPQIGGGGGFSALQGGQGGDLLGGADIGALVGLMRDPMASAGDREVLGALLQRRLQAGQGMSELERIQLEQARFNLEQDMNAPADPWAGVQEINGQLVRMGPNGPEVIGDFNRENEDIPAGFRALQLRAEAAGLQPGTPEYGQFMLDQGNKSGLAIDVDPATGQVSVRQGSGAGNSEKPFTDAQSKSIIYATRAEGALEILDPIADNLASRGQSVLEGVPFGLGRGAQDADFQRAKAAGDEFLQAILRKDTGAAITEQEQVLYGRTYLPQPGDGPEVIAHKAQARRRALEALRASMSPAEMLAQERALSATGQAPQQPSSPYQSREAFIADPGVIQAAREAGVTPEAMWEVMQGANQ